MTQRLPALLTGTALAAAALAGAAGGPLPARADSARPVAPLHYEQTEVDGHLLLADDPAGTGRVVEVIGDLDTADDVAIVVPGSGQNRENFRHSDAHPGTVPLDNGRALYKAMRAQLPDRAVAVVVWLGYQPPQNLGSDAISSTRARLGAAELARFTRHWIPDSAHTTLVCHSYGSTVCGLAAREPSVADDVVALASPGMGVRDAGGIRARVWATRAADDWIRFVPSFRLGPYGLGGDPMRSAFGATTFPAGAVSGHDQYYTPGSAALTTTAAIALGTRPHGARPATVAPSRSGHLAAGPHAGASPTG
ncbi:alpha/beta hydrolase [Nocardiopsis sediminis]|uniref:Alpha/beta hydrolase n=1 Tax=Nocardiopsis sediminis TaxID=1778267 RepID=A0ABV8FM46_9ACTN